jgi:hypothetical protein
MLGSILPRILNANSSIAELSTARISSLSCENIFWRDFIFLGKFNSFLNSHQVNPLTWKATTNIDLE